MKNYELSFQGFWQVSHHSQLPNEAGVYAAYACVRDQNSGRLIPERLIQVGDCTSLQSQSETIASEPEMAKNILPGEEVGYAFAPLTFGRQQAAAALIYQHKPIGNFQYKFHFPFEKTEVSVRGDAPRMKQQFNVPDPADRDVMYLFDRFFSRKTA